MVDRLLAIRKFVDQKRGTSACYKRTFAGQDSFPPRVVGAGIATVHEPRPAGSTTAEAILEDTAFGAYPTGHCCVCGSWDIGACT